MSDTKSTPSEQALRAILKPPIAEEEMREHGYTAWRTLPDGSILTVGPMLHGNGRLFIDVHRNGYEDCYCYDTIEGATQAMFAFNPETEKEPTGWKRHPLSGRRRPNGDASQEFIAR